MKWSWHVGKIAGIDVKIHWTFFVLLVWIGAAYLTQGRGVAAAMFGITSVISVFACVLLHEFGHALTARHYGISTVDITLLPIGGVARLREMPSRPWEELMVALAGPAVNVVIALVLGLILWSTGNGSVLWPSSVDDAAQMATVSVPKFLANLTLINIFLVIFNLLPAFPMDGGRVLRAILAMKMDRVQATDMAASVGQFMAILFGIAGLFGNHPMLMFIALFVYLGASAEAEMVRVQSVLGDLTVQTGMMARFRTLQQTDTLSQARDAILEGSQQDFPVLDGERLVGMLYRGRLIESLKELGPDAAISNAMMATDGDKSTVPEPVVPVLRVDGRLQEALNSMREEGFSTLPVLDGSRLVGIISNENITELIMLRDAELNYTSTRPADRRSSPGR
ncbi:MAG: site-2 protease family protein [Pirellulales bacterium]